jgi:RNA polymerase sigma factor for flagellar operon FliA
MNYQSTIDSTQQDSVTARQNAEALLIKHASLVKKIALHIQARLPDSVQLDDLLQAGMMGLLEASKSFDPSKGASFETYAGIRIRGSVIDEVRTSDWIPRSVSKNIREIAAAIHAVEVRTSRKATEPEIARELNITLEQYQKISREASSARILSSDEMLDEDGHAYLDIPSPEDDPSVRLQSMDRERLLAERIKALPERERLVMSLYYEQELNLKEIGSILGVSESRVSQIHGQALARIKADLAGE